MKKMQSLILAAVCLICTIETVYGYNVGNGASGLSGQEDGYCLYNNYTITLTSGYKAVLDRFEVYVYNTSAVGGSAKCGVYSSDASLMFESQTGTVTSSGWKTFDISAELLSGNYFFAVAVDTGVGVHWGGTGINTVLSNYTTGYSLSQYPSLIAYGNANRYISMLIYYDIEPIGGDPAIWAGVYTGGLMLILLVAILMFRYNVPILGFIYGIFAIGMGTTSIMNTNTLFSPYLELGVFTISALLMFYSGKRGLNK